MHVQVLGALNVSGPSVSDPHLPRALRRLVAVLAAAGPQGTARDIVATAVWGEPLPDSWKSALRNRVTACRKILGVDTIQTDGGHFRFADDVSVDSWDLIAHSTSRFNGNNVHELSFLEGEPFVNMKTCELLADHIDLIADARAALLQEIVGAGTELSSQALQALRGYQRHHPLDAIVTTFAVKAHIQAGLLAHAIQLTSEVQLLRQGAHLHELSWVSNLDRLIADADETPTDRRRGPEPDLRPSEVTARAELFRSAASDGNWNLALEIATSGLPEAELSGGDPARLELLQAIPLDQVESIHRPAYCLIIARHFMYAGREDEARTWARTARELARTPHEELQSFIQAAMLDDSRDQRTPIPLPAGFATDPPESISMQSLQVAVLSHVERASFADADAVRKRFSFLVEASAKPYRRWHLLLLESMDYFLGGELNNAAEAARTAFRHAEFFGIAAAEMALLGQLSNAHWIHPGFPGIRDYQEDFPGSTDRTLSRVLHAIAIEPSAAGTVDEFLQTYRHRSPSLFTLPIVMLASPFLRDPAARLEVLKRLQARTDTSAIYGSGIMHLGPVDRALARLVDTDEETIQHLTAAIQVADRQCMRLWQVVCRLDLAHASKNDEFQRQAEDLATTPELLQLTREYARIRSS